MKKTKQKNKHTTYSTCYVLVLREKEAISDHLWKDHEKNGCHPSFATIQIKTSGKAARQKQPKRCDLKKNACL